MCPHKRCWQRDAALNGKGEASGTFASLVFCGVGTRNTGGFAVDLGALKDTFENVSKRFLAYGPSWYSCFIATRLTTQYEGNVKSDHERRQHEQNADRYLCEVDNAYLFDETSRLYRAKSPDTEEDRQKSPEHQINFQPVVIVPETKQGIEWLKAIIDGGGLILSAVTIVLVFITAVFTGHQWQESRRSADASIEAVQVADQARIEAKSASDQNAKDARRASEIASKSAKDSLRAANVSTEATRAANRAYVLASLGASGLTECPDKINKVLPDTYCGSLEFRNFGETPATNIAVFASIHADDDKGYIPISVGPCIGSARNVLFKNDSDVCVMKGAEQSDVAELQKMHNFALSTKQIYMVHGYIRFDDIYNFTHIVPFCYVYPLTSTSVTNRPHTCPIGSGCDLALRTRRS